MSDLARDLLAVHEALRLEVALWASCGPRPERRGWHAGRCMSLESLARFLADQLISPGC